MGTRVRVGLVGQATGFSLIRVELEAEESAIRAQLISRAAGKLGVKLPDDISGVQFGKCTPKLVHQSQYSF